MDFFPVLKCVAANHAWRDYSTEQNVLQVLFLHYFANLESRFDKLESRFDNLESRFDSLETRVDNFESETKRRFENLEANLRSVDKHVCELDASVSELQRSVKELWLHVENTTDWKLQVVAENHSNLLQKLEEQQKRWETQERLLFYVNKHEKDITAIKQRLCM